MAAATFRLRPRSGPRRLKPAPTVLADSVMERERARGSSKLTWNHTRLSTGDRRWGNISGKGDVRIEHIPKKNNDHASRPIASAPPGKIHLSGHFNLLPLEHLTSGMEQPRPSTPIGEFKPSLNDLQPVNHGDNHRVHRHFLVLQDLNGALTFLNDQDRISGTGIHGIQGKDIAPGELPGKIDRLDD